MRKIGSLVVILFISLVVIQNASAHKVQMFAYVEGEKVFVEGYFADGKRTIKSEVIVSDNISGKRLLSGHTDDAGKFSFIIPGKTDLRIELMAGMGHKTEYVIQGSELSGIVDIGSRDSAGPDSQVDTSEVNVSGTNRSSLGNETEIQLMVERGVQKSIIPLLRGFSECKERVFYSEIIGGIGYIVGVMGIVFYFKARKKTE